MPTVVLKPVEVVDAQHISVSIGFELNTFKCVKLKKEKTTTSRSINAVKEPR